MWALLRGQEQPRLHGKAAGDDGQPDIGAKYEIGCGQASASHSVSLETHETTPRVHHGKNTFM